MTTFPCFNSRTPGGVRLEFSAPRDLIPRFQFTHPGRGATPHAYDEWLVIRCFNSRTPGGVRLCSYDKFSIALMFQFTHPGRGATNELDDKLTDLSVSIHAPREGCD